MDTCRYWWYSHTHTHTSCRNCMYCCVLGKHTSQRTIPPFKFYQTKQYLRNRLHLRRCHWDWLKNRSGGVMLFWDMCWGGGGSVLSQMHTNPLSDLSVFTEIETLNRSELILRSTWGAENRVGEGGWGGGGGAHPHTLADSLCFCVIV